MKIPVNIFLMCFVLLFACQNEEKTKGFFEHNPRFLKTLTKNNLNYFVKEEPDKFRFIPEYKSLFQLDSLANILIQQKNSGSVDKKMINIFVQKMKLFCGEETTKKVESLLMDERYGNDKYIFSETLLEALYIFGNEAVKSYNYSLFRMPFSKIIALSQSDFFKKGDTVMEQFYLACLNPNKKIIVIIDGDTLPNINGIPFYKAVATNAGLVKKRGKYLIYREESGEYISRNFEFQYLVHPL